MPFGALQTPSTTFSNTVVAPASFPSTENQATKETDSIPLDSEEQQAPNHHTSDPQLDDDHESQNRQWKEAQHWKRTAWHTPNGFMLDPSCERFISYSGEEQIPVSSVLKSRSGPSDNDHEISKSHVHNQNRPVMSTAALETAQNKVRRTGKGIHKSPTRKRSKYSDLPRDVEKALELITSRLEDASRSRRSQDDVDSKAQAMEQKLKIQEGEALLSRQEMQAVKQKLFNEVSNVDRLKAENADLREKLHEARGLAEQKENELKNWQGMLRTMIGSSGGESAS
jgi:regulator of replication initiation timing